MPKQRQPGDKPPRDGLLKIRVQAEWLEVVTQAARAMGQSVSDYVREAVNVKVEVDGYQVPGKEKGGG